MSSPEELWGVDEAPFPWSSDSTDSDIDVLYELAPGSRLGWKIEDLTDELTAVLGRPVDLISRKSIHAHLRESVLREARVLYAA